MTKSIALATAVLAAGLAVGAQERQPQVFPAEVEVVALDIGVVDGNGAPVRGLAAADFGVTVDGKPRRVVSAEFVSQADVEGQTQAPPPPAHLTSNERLVPGRLVLIAVDQANIPMGAGRDVIQAAGRLIDRLSDADKVGLLSLPGPEPREEFTSNHDRVKEALGQVAGRGRFGGRRVSVVEALAYAEDDDPERWGAAVTRECSDGNPECIRGLGAEASQIAWEYREQSQRSIAVLRSAFDVLKGVEGQKVVVLVTQGLGMPDAGSRPGRVSSEVQELARAAADARVSFFAVQVKAQAGSTSVESELPPEVLDDDSALHSQALTHLAVLARGAVLRGKPEQAFDRVAREISGYYLVGFEPEGKDRDGKPHTVLVSVHRPGITVRNRRSVPLPAADDAKAEERSLVASLRAPIPATAIPVRVATYAVRDSEPGKVRLLISAELGRHGARDLGVAWVLIDGRGKTAASSVQRETADAAAGDGPVPFTAVARVAPGLYTLKIAARDRIGRQGSVDHPVKAALIEAGGLQMSDLMLALPPSRGAGMRPGLGLDGAVDPLVADIELYGDARKVAVSFEIAHDDRAAALFALPARISSIGGRNVAQAVIPISGLAPGDYVVRASVTVGGTTIGSPTHPFRVKGS
jgi:VWFA-related protein